MSDDYQESGFFGLIKPYEMKIPQVPNESEVLKALLLLPDEAFVWKPRKQVYVCWAAGIKVELRPSSLKELNELKQSFVNNPL